MQFPFSGLLTQFPNSIQGIRSTKANVSLYPKQNIQLKVFKCVKSQIRKERVT